MLKADQAKKPNTYNQFCDLDNLPEKVVRINIEIYADVLLLDLEHFRDYVLNLSLNANAEPHASVILLM